MAPLRLRLHLKHPLANCPCASLQQASHPRYPGGDARAAAAAPSAGFRLKLGASVYEAGTKLSYVYFPTTAIVSLLYVMEDGASAEIAVVGNEGIVGIALFMGGETTPSRAVVQSAGHALSLEAPSVMKRGVQSRRPRCCICCCATPRR